jgi:glycine cleavage system regulatory protein
MTSLVLSIIGEDRPGLVSSISQCVADCGANWLDSRMSSLAGKFAGILLIDAPEARTDELIHALRALERQGLQLRIQRGSTQAAAGGGRTLKLDLTGQDRPGIVREISDTLAQRKVSIEEMETAFFSGSFSGEGMFELHARLRVPAELPDGALRQALEALSQSLMVDISLD